MLVLLPLFPGLARKRQPAALHQETLPAFQQNGIKRLTQRRCEEWGRYKHNRKERESGADSGRKVLQIQEAVRLKKGGEIFQI